MKKIIFIFISFLFLSCSFDPIVMARGKDKEYFEFLEQTKEAKRITIDKAYDLYESGKAILISVDQSRIYYEKHIVGAINIPLSDLIKVVENGKLKLPKDKVILLYCR